MRLPILTAIAIAAVTSFSPASAASTAASDDPGLGEFFAALFAPQQSDPSAADNQPRRRPTGRGNPEIEVTYTKAWLAEQPMPEMTPPLSCLAEALYFEARGESVKGQFAVAEVVLNRVASSRYPDTICEVINQGTGRKYACQFTYTCDGLPETIRELKAHDQVTKVAGLMMAGAPRQLTDGATHYHTKDVNPSWARVFPRTAVIGVHLFYRMANR